MILTQKDIWLEIAEIKTTKRQIPDISSLFSHIVSKYNLSDSQKLYPVLKRQLNLYRNRDRKKQQNGSATIVFRCDDDGKQPIKILPQKRKSFLNLKSQMQSVRTKLLLEKINDFLNEENKGCDTPISMTQLLGYLIHRVNYATDKKKRFHWNEHLQTGTHTEATIYKPGCCCTDARLNINESSDANYEILSCR